MLIYFKPVAVHIATPPEWHVALATLALNAGCHVFVEAHFALTESGAQIILDQSHRVRRKVSVNDLYDFEPPGRQLDKLLGKNVLGEVLHLDAHYGYNLNGCYGLTVMSDPGHWVHLLPGKRCTVF